MLYFQCLLCFIIDVALRLCYFYVLCLQRIIEFSEVRGRWKAGLSWKNGEVEEDYLIVTPGPDSTFKAGENEGMGWETMEFPSEKHY